MYLVDLSTKPSFRSGYVKALANEARSSIRDFGKYLEISVKDRFVPKYPTSCQAGAYQSLSDGDLPANAPSSADRGTFRRFGRAPLKPQKFRYTLLLPSPGPECQRHSNSFGSQSRISSSSSFKSCHNQSVPSLSRESADRQSIQ